MIGLPEMFDWSPWSACSKTCFDSVTSLPLKKRARCGQDENSKCIYETTTCTNLQICPLGT